MKSTQFQTLEDVREGRYPAKNVVPWSVRIARARKRGLFNKTDYNLALKWIDCACGQQDKRIPRGDNNEPLDSKLFELGDRFASAVRQDHFASAESLLAQIETRAREILAGLTEAS